MSWLYTRVEDLARRFVAQFDFHWTFRVDGRLNIVDRHAFREFSTAV